MLYIQIMSCFGAFVLGLIAAIGLNAWDFFKKRNEVLQEIRVGYIPVDTFWFLKSMYDIRNEDDGIVVLTAQDRAAKNFTSNIQYLLSENLITPIIDSASVSFRITRRGYQCLLSIPYQYSLEESEDGTLS